MTTIEILRAARELLAVPERWTHGAFARRRDGERTGPIRPDAVCWCVSGAIDRVVAFGPVSDAITCKVAVHETLDLHGVSAWNDAPERTHAEVIDALDRTIARLEG